jgi:hypothetical protein
LFAPSASPIAAITLPSATAHEPGCSIAFQLDPKQQNGEQESRSVLLQARTLKVKPIIIKYWKR